MKKERDFLKERYEKERRKRMKNSKENPDDIYTFFDKPTKEYWMGRRVKVYKIYMRMKDRKTRSDCVSHNGDFWWEEVKVGNVLNYAQQDYSRSVTIPSRKVDIFTGKQFVLGWITGFGTVQNGYKIWDSDAGNIWYPTKTLKCVKIRFNPHHKEIHIPLDGFDLEQPFYEDDDERISSQL